MSEKTETCRQTKLIWYKNTSQVKLNGRSTPLGLTKGAKGYVNIILNKKLNPIVPKNKKFVNNLQS